MWSSAEILRLVAVTSGVKLLEELESVTGEVKLLEELVTIKLCVSLSEACQLSE